MKVTSTAPDSKEVVEINKKLAEKRKQHELATQGQNHNALALLPNHICICIDISGSMSASFPPGSHTSREDAANIGLQAIISASNPKKTAYSVVSIDDAAELLIPPTNSYLTIQSKQFRDGGSTDGFGAIRMARTLSPRPTRIIVLTDGYWGYEDGVYELASTPPIIPIDTIAIGEGKDSFLMHLSEITGGIFKRANTPEELKQHFILLEPANYLQLTHQK